MSKNWHGKGKVFACHPLNVKGIIEVMMDSFELNKIAGAVLATLLVVLGMQFLSSAIFTHKKLEKPGFAVAVVEKAAEGAAPVAALTPIAGLLASASVEKGALVAKQCATCHALEKGVSKPTGPSLYGVVERERGKIDGFKYSPALVAKGGAWSYEELNAFLNNPKAAIAGTIMAYAGVKKDSDRADVILYLRSLADKPADLPK
jgi:cytochrome c